jgi:hypothetical protein
LALAGAAEGDVEDGDDEDAGGVLELDELLHAAAVSDTNAIASSAAVRAGFPRVIPRT